MTYAYVNVNSRQPTSVRSPNPPSSASPHAGGTRLPGAVHRCHGGAEQAGTCVMVSVPLPGQAEGDGPADLGYDNPEPYDWTLSSTEGERVARAIMGGAR
jgi:hypothetical protein